MKNLMMMLALLSYSILVFSHDGGHGPVLVEAPRGGVILKTEALFVEVVGTKTEVKIYPMLLTDPKGKSLKALPLKEVKLTASLTLPRAKKAEAIKLIEAGDHFVGVLAVGKTHRYEVMVNLEYLNDKDKLKFIIEPE